MQLAKSTLLPILFTILFAILFDILFAILLTILISVLFVSRIPKLHLGIRLVILQQDPHRIHGVHSVK